jgi:hypothetical protein
MSQQVSFYYHIDANGNYWFPLFPTEEEATAADLDRYSATNPGAHFHEFDGNVWWMPDTMAAGIK